MKYLMISLLCFISLLFMANTCDNSDEYHSLEIENSSGETIYITMGRNKEISLIDVFVNGESSIFSIKDEDSFPTGIAQDEVLYVLVFKQSTMNKYSKEELANKYIYDKLYTLSYSDLEKINFKIIYTGE